MNTTRIRRRQTAAVWAGVFAFFTFIYLGVPALAELAAGIVR